MASPSVPARSRCVLRLIALGRLIRGALLLAAPRRPMSWTGLGSVQRSQLEVIDTALASSEAARAERRSPPAIDFLPHGLEAVAATAAVEHLSEYPMEVVGNGLGR
jgi:hypothetical protein